MIEYSMEHICSFTATLKPPEVIGTVPEGLRLNIYITGGEVTGPKIRGKVLPVGGDWITIRSDGVAILDVRATIETHDAALIYVTYNGLTDFGESGYEKALNGEIAGVSRPIRTNPRMVSSHPAYQWVNRAFYLGVGHSFPEGGKVAYDVYAVR